MSYLSLEIGRTYDGMMIAIPAPHWVLFQELSDKAFANVLRELGVIGEPVAISEASSRSQEKAS